MSESIGNHLIEAQYRVFDVLGIFEVFNALCVFGPNFLIGFSIDIKRDSTLGYQTRGGFSEISSK
jgi:hypothetical protein